MERNTDERWGCFDWYSKAEDEHHRFDLHNAIEVNPFDPMPDEKQDKLQEELNNLLKWGQEYSWDWIEKIVQLVHTETRREINQNKLDEIASYCNIAGATSTAYLLDQDGEAIRERSHMNNVLDRWFKTLYEKKSPSEWPYKNDKVWLSTFDVHT